jgi:hypothetical protein
MIFRQIFIHQNFRCGLQTLRMNDCRALLSTIVRDIITSTSRLSRALTGRRSLPSAMSRRLDNRSRYVRPIAPRYFPNDVYYSCSTIAHTTPFFRPPLLAHAISFFASRAEPSQVGVSPQVLPRRRPCLNDSTTPCVAQEETHCAASITTRIILGPLSHIRRRSFSRRCLLASDLFLLRAPSVHKSVVLTQAVQSRRPRFFSLCYVLAA